MNITMTSIQEQSHFPPSIREAIHAAHQEAIRMNAQEVEPEHLFLGVLAQNDDGVAETCRALRLDQRMLREQVAALFPMNAGTSAKGEKDVSFSQEVQACLEWATSFATHLQASQVQLEHVLLGSVRHWRIQPLLALFLLNAGSTLPSYMTERSDLAYTATIDQLIAARVRRRNVVDSDTSNRTLSSIERPALAFSDIAGFQKVKQELQDVINFLKQPQLVQQDRRSYLYGLFLVGSASNNRTLIGKATAGEAGVPLLSLSIRALLETANDAHGKRESGHAEAQRGRHIIHNLFEQGKKASPCILWLDEVDLLGRPEMKAVGEQWQSQLRMEMDGYNTRPAMAAIATISQAEQIDQLQLSNCFDHVTTMDGTAARRFEAGVWLCVACQQEIPTNWKYCGFCGTAVGKVCAQCGTLSPDVKGVVFCPECGSSL